MKTCKMRRFLALLLSVAMLLGCVGVSAFAEEELVEEPVIELVEEPIPAEDNTPSAPAVPEEEAPPADPEPAGDPVDVPVQAPEKQPDETPAEVFAGSVAAVLQNEGEILEGDTLVYLARVDGNASLVSVHWQVEAEGEAPAWEDLAAGERFSLTANAENLAKNYRVALFDAAGTLCASAALVLPEITEEELIELEPIEEETPAEAQTEEAFDEPVPEETAVESSVSVETADANTVSVTYVKRGWNGSSVTTESATRENVTIVPSDGSMTSGWYYLNSNVTKNGRIFLEGDTNLILGDGCTLNVKGLYIPQGSTLTIYAQSDGASAGKLISKPSSGAGIGATSDNHPGGNIVIHGGYIDAKGADHCAGLGSNDGNGTTAPITIFGGTVTATGGDDGAGIGGGRNCDGGTITIYGGNITAHGGGENGAGIGGGDSGDGGTIVIWGGTITANEDPNEDGAGIGGGDAGDGGDITIHGGIVNCWGRDGAGIGGGDSADGGTITINGGAVTCRDGGHAQGARIGGGCDGDGGTITINGGEVRVYNRDGAGIGGGEGADGGTILITGGEIYTFPEGEGNGAGIGGGNHSGAGGSITITGGSVYATSDHGAAIGGGRARNNSDYMVVEQERSGSGGTITITGGYVEAFCNHGYGIGAGCAYVYLDYASSDLHGSMGTVTIGGTARVDAYGATAGIGGNPGALTIKDKCKVTASGRPANEEYIDCGHGILAPGSNVYISGGELTAKGLSDYKGFCTKNVEYTGGTLTATSKNEDCVYWSKVTFREDARFLMGRSESTATVVPPDQRASVKETSAKYLHISVCDHSSRSESGLCPDCWDQAFPVTYIERSWDGAKVVATEKDTPEGTAAFPYKDNTCIPAGWYYLSHDITVDDRVCLEGDTHLILGDGCTLDVEGLYIPDGSTLTIYAQSNGENAGKLVSKPDDGAAIGGYSGHDNGSIVIHGGIIEAKGADHCAGIGTNDGKTGGAITIYGGTITAKGGGDGAGIGGGRDCDGGTITVYGGYITANGPTSSDCCENGAGLGGGQRGGGGSITIWGGTITTYSRDGAGLGGGDDGDGGTITIHGGTITSEKVNQGQGARIGGGCDAAPGTVTIDGGSITTVSGSGAGIGGGRRNTAGGSVTITGGVINASGVSNEGGSYGIGNGEEGADVTVTLGWTDATEETISITSSSFNGTVTLEQPFVMYSTGRLFRVGAVSDNSLLVGGELTAMTGSVSTWEQLRIALECGGSIVVSGDITASSDDHILRIPAGITVELDLQGHTVDASALNPPAGVEYPCCLSINGSLTLSDTVGGGRFKGGDNGFIDFIATESGSSFTMCGGTIVGSGTLENVVYVYDYSTFTMCGGAVTADMNGTVRRFGRVSVDDYATFIMNDGTISGSGGQSDIYADGGCVWLNGGSLTGSDPAYGNVYVLSADQIKNGQLFVSGSPLMSKGVYLDYDHTITVAGPLGENVIIPVMTEAKPTSAEPVIITNGLAQGGENAVSHFTSASDIWCVVLNDDGEAELRKAPTEWDTLQLLIDGTENGGVLTLEKDYTATNKDRYLNIAGGKALTIDLNGHTIDGSALNDDYVMTISGNLTLRDSTGGGTVLGRNHQDVIKTTSENAVLCLESGTIHGDNCYDVVYVYAGGSFIMTGGTVSGSGSSGHIDVLVECGTFTLTGGSIRADQKGSDTAVLTTKYTNFNLQGSPDIKGSFELGKPVQFTGPISHDLRIKVRRTGDLHNEWNDVFTSGLPGNGTVNNFISYYPKNYAVGLNEAGEAFLGSPVTVAFAPGYETNETMETVSWAKDGWYPLPTCGFSGPAGKAFAGWLVGEDTEPKGAGELIRITGDMTLTAEWEDLPSVTINGVSGSFNDRIKLNFYFDIPDAVLEDEAAYVTLTNGNSGKTVTLLVGDAEFDEDKGYKFSIPLAAKEAVDTITARVYDGEGHALPIKGNLRGADYTETGVPYSLMQYFAWLEENGTDAEKAVGAAAKDYCAAAAIYFDYNADGLSVSSAVTDLNADTLNTYIAGRDGTLPNGVSVAGITAMLESDNTLRLYLKFKKVDPASLTFLINGDQVALQQRSDGMYYLALGTGVWSNHLQNEHYYTVSDGTNTFTLTASVLTFARASVVNGGETDINLGKALYLYNQAAVAAFGQ